ncbi:hypothetical protein F4775DRAFT_590346 [Biscogniauxia sp. FL1348]|nr:hypothetical protein F4775DRAFT_590346 [Biscogniauxia sp. FL1348]
MTGEALKVVGCIPRNYATTTSTIASVAPLRWAYVASGRHGCDRPRASVYWPTTVLSQPDAHNIAQVEHTKSQAVPAHVANLKIADSHGHASWTSLTKRLPARRSGTSPTLDQRPNLLPNFGQKTVDGFKACLTQTLLLGKHPIYRYRLSRCAMLENGMPIRHVVSMVSHARRIVAVPLKSLRRFAKTAAMKQYRDRYLLSRTTTRLFSKCAVGIQNDEQQATSNVHTPFCEDA